MILYDDCKNCIYGSTVKCESGDEYIVCSIWTCSEEKMKSADDMKGDNNNV